MDWMRLPFIHFAACFGVTLTLLEHLGPLAGAPIEPIFVSAAALIIAMRRVGVSWPVCGMIAAIGLSAAHARADSHRHGLVFEIAEGRARAELVGTVVEPARVIDGRWSTTLEVESIDDDDMHHALRVRLRGETAVPQASSRIQVFAQLERPGPDEFPTRRHRRRTAEREGRPLRALALETPQVLDGPGAVGAALDGLSGRRRGLQARLLEELGELRGGMAIALLTGEKAWVNPRVMQAYNDTGTAHVLAISGLHFGIIAMLAWFASLALIRRSKTLMTRWGDRRVAGVAVAFVLSIFLLFVGAPVSAVRAWVVALLLILSLSSLRAFCPFHALAWAFVLVLVVEPWAIGELGFQLSFAATLGILIFMDRKPAWLEAPAFGEESAWRARGRAAGLSVGISTAATLLTTPVILAHTGFVSIGALWTNLLVVPAVSVFLFPALLAGVALDSAGFAAGLILAGFSMDAMLAFAHLLEIAARLPGQSLVFGIPPLGASILLFLATALLLARPRRVAAAVLTALLMVSLAWAATANRSPDSVEVHMIPVGQGDSILVRLPSGDMLIDTGGAMMGRDPGRSIVMPYLRRIGISRLHAVVISHDDIDHFGGLAAIREVVAIDQIIRDPPEPISVGTPAARLKLARARGCEGDNNSSLVTILEVEGQHRAMFTGDIERCAEAWITARRVATPVVQAPHHGSNSSSGDEFIGASGARIVLVSTGRHSRFGHPHPAVLKRWYHFGSRVLTTPRHGLVVLSWTPDTLRVHATRPIWAAR